MAVDLAGKTAIISGGGSGLGRALAKQLVLAQVNVVLVSRREEVLNETAIVLNALGKGKAVAMVGDVRNKLNIENIVIAVCEQFGSIDILVNCSGLAIASTVEECMEEDWDTVINTNLKGTFLFSQAVLPSMKAQKTGYILNIASQAAKRGYPMVASYCASKFGILGFSDALQQEVKADGIRVHCLNPGLIQTPEPSSPTEINPEILSVADAVESAMFVLTRPSHVKIEDLGMYNLFDSQL